MDGRAIQHRQGQSPGTGSYPSQTFDGGAQGSQPQRTYFRAKQYFDFCQWVILSTAFAAISLYFINHPVYALQYAACLIAALTITALAFWHLARTLHAYVASILSGCLQLVSTRPRPVPLRAIALVLDVVILAGFIHMLKIFSTSLLARMDIVLS